MDWSYIAGFIDGEGSIILSEGRVKIAVPNTNINVLNEICKFIGVGNVNVYNLKNPEWKPCGA